MRLVCISDTHTMADQITLPEGDVLIHAGDALGRGNQEEFLNFVNWLGRQRQFAFKMYVPGNHDIYVEKHVRLARELLKNAGTRLLIDEVAGIRGVRFYGSPWVRSCGNWAFSAEENYLAQRFKRIDPDVQVLITHSPPENIGDIGSYSHAGSESLADKVKELSERRLKYHIYGHIHECYGLRSLWGVEFANVSICTREYKPINRPTVIDL